MYRRSGLIVLLLGVVFVYFLAFTPSKQETRHWTRNDQGQRVKVVAVCESPWSLFVEGNSQDGRYVTDVETCRKGARLNASIGVLAAVTALGLGIWGILRGPRPQSRRLTPFHEIFDMSDN